MIAGSLHILKRYIHALGLEIFKHLLIKDILILQINIRIQEFHIPDIHITLDNLRIIGNDRTVEVIISHFLIDVVGHTRIENRFQALIDQGLDVTVHQLCRITDSVTWNRMLS